MPCGKKRKRQKMNTHKRKKRLRAKRHKKKDKQIIIDVINLNQGCSYLFNDMNSLFYYEPNI